MTVDDFKAELRHRRARHNNRIGTYGEHLYAAVLEDQNHVVKSMRREGRDFLVDGHLHVDVKAALSLGKRSHLGAPRWTGAGRKQGVLYHRVMFYDDAIVIGSSIEGDPLGTLKVSWEKALNILTSGRHLGRQEAAAPSLHRIAQKRMLQGLKNRLQELWAVDAKVVYRDNPTAQKAMGEWGPESFHPSKAQRLSKDLVVLVYFDGSDVDKVFAYPMRCWAEIAWKDKSVGPNPHRRKTFDPAKLDAKFKFKSLKEFEDNFLSRFLRN